ncbi:hypothetical protein B4110_3018 [Parageobacillus toebii]|uniref:Uncharacterized protein n=1 Tax=Parageobacillus toebii TaxID=153151 RepID=A0A150N3S3_9BACL|nr:hypothetical protein B4110_3018 [Parageobacillus toebii]
MEATSLRCKEIYFFTNTHIFSKYYAFYKRTIEKFQGGIYR